jgi:O-antigen ligase
MNNPSRWQQRLFFFSLVAVLFTTLFAWFNLNSICIMLLVVSRLLYGGKPLRTIGAAFTDRLFLAYLLFLVIESAGYLHTHDLVEQGKVVSKEATLVAIAFALCTIGIPALSTPATLTPVAGDTTYRRLLTWYSLLVAAASLYCLAVALHNYLLTGDNSVFFYHLLTRPISQNAVFFSVYVVFAVVFLLAPGGAPAIAGWPPRYRKILRVVLVSLFAVMIVLLDSKLMLVITVLLLLHAFTRHYRLGKNKWLVLGSAIVLLVALCIIAVTDNPVGRRYREMAVGDLGIVRQENFRPDMYFSSVQLRLLEWRFAKEILNAHHAWVFGVSPGDSQDLLDQKYIATHMYIGNPDEGPHRKVRGFIGYNYHNQYLETLVRSGIVGLAVLLGIFFLLFSAARRHGTREGWFVVSIIALFFIPEAPLTMQHGVFLFAFFPLLVLNGPANRPVSPE